MSLPVEKKPYVLNLKNEVISDKGKKEGITSLGKRNIQVLGFNVTGVKSGGLRAFFISLGQKILHSNSKNPPKSEGAYKWTKIKGKDGAKYWVKTEELAGHFGVTDFSSKKTEKIVPNTNTNANTNNIIDFETENIPMQKDEKIYAVKEKEIVKEITSKFTFNELSEKRKNIYSFLEIKSSIECLNKNLDYFKKLFKFEDSKIIIENTNFTVDLESEDCANQIIKLKEFIKLLEFANTEKYCPFLFTEKGFIIKGIDLSSTERFNFNDAKSISNYLLLMNSKSFNVEKIKYKQVDGQMEITYQLGEDFNEDTDLKVIVDKPKEDVVSKEVLGKKNNLLNKNNIVIVGKTKNTSEDEVNNKDELNNQSSVDNPQEAVLDNVGVFFKAICKLKDEYLKNEKNKLEEKN